MYCAVISLSFLGSDCGGIPPKMEADIWMGSSTDGALIRCITPPGQPCGEWDMMYPTDERIDGMIAMDVDKFSQYVKEVVGRCERWSE